MTGRESAVRALYGAARIEDQLCYYERTAAAYTRAHSQAVTLRQGLLLAAALCGVVATVVPPAGRVALGIAGAVLGAFAGAVTGFESLIGFEHLAKLYSDAAANLRSEAVGWTASTEELAADVDRIEAVLKKEIAQWGQLRKEAHGHNL